MFFRGQACIEELSKVHRAAHLKKVLEDVLQGMETYIIKHSC
jgi:hypothetical protein